MLEMTVKKIEIDEDNPKRIMVHAAGSYGSYFKLSFTPKEASDYELGIRYRVSLEEVLQ